MYKRELNSLNRLLAAVLSGAVLLSSGCTPGKTAETESSGGQQTEAGSDAADSESSEAGAENAQGDASGSGGAGSEDAQDAASENGDTSGDSAASGAELSCLRKNCMLLWILLIKIIP